MQVYTESNTIVSPGTDSPNSGYGYNWIQSSQLVEDRIFAVSITTNSYLTFTVDIYDGTTITNTLTGTVPFENGVPQTLWLSPDETVAYIFAGCAPLNYNTYPYVYYGSYLQFNFATNTVTPFQIELPYVAGQTNEGQLFFDETMIVLDNENIVLLTQGSGYGDDSTGTEVIVSYPATLYWYNANTQTQNSTVNLPEPPDLTDPTSATGGMVVVNEHSAIVTLVWAGTDQDKTDGSLAVELWTYALNLDSQTITSSYQIIKYPYAYNGGQGGGQAYGLGYSNVGMCQGNLIMLVFPYQFYDGYYNGEHSPTYMYAVPLSSGVLGTAKQFDWNQEIYTGWAFDVARFYPFESNACISYDGTTLISAGSLTATWAPYNESLTVLTFDLNAWLHDEELQWVYSSPASWTYYGGALYIYAGIGKDYVINYDTQAIYELTQGTFDNCVISVNKAPSTGAYTPVVISLASTSGQTLYTPQGSNEKVYFGSTPAINITNDVSEYSTQNQITVNYVPPGTGTVPISYSVGGVEFSTNLAFSYATAPTVTEVSLNSGNPGDTVTISGTGLDTVTAVNFGASSANFTLTDATHISATVPGNLAAGPVHVTVVNPVGTSALSSADEFTYESKPTIVIAEWGYNTPLDAAFDDDFTTDNFTNRYVATGTPSVDAELLTSSSVNWFDPQGQVTFPASVFFTVSPDYLTSATAGWEDVGQNITISAQLTPSLLTLSVSAPALNYSNSVQAAISFSDPTVLQISLSEDYLLQATFNAEDLSFTLPDNVIDYLKQFVVYPASTLATSTTSTPKYLITTSAQIGIENVDHSVTPIAAFNERYDTLYTTKSTSPEFLIVFNTDDNALSTTTKSTLLSSTGFTTPTDVPNQQAYSLLPYLIQNPYNRTINSNYRAWNGPADEQFVFIMQADNANALNAALYTFKMNSDGSLAYVGEAAPVENQRPVTALITGQGYGPYIFDQTEDSVVTFIDGSLLLTHPDWTTGILHDGGIIQPSNFYYSNINYPVVNGICVVNENGYPSWYNFNGTFETGYSNNMVSTADATYTAVTPVNWMSPEGTVYFPEQRVEIYSYGRFGPPQSIADNNVVGLTFPTYGLWVHCSSTDDYLYGPHTQFRIVRFNEDATMDTLAGPFTLPDALTQTANINFSILPLNS